MCEHCEHNHKEDNNNKIIIRIILTVILVICAYITKNRPLYLFAYIIAGYDIIFSAIKNIFTKNFFDENFLMSIATIGAVCIGEYPEAVCVMILYKIGEFLQDMSVEKSQKSISELIKIMPDYANIEENGEIIHISPDEIKINDILTVKAGERVPVDGTVIEGSANFDTSSITGESRLKNISQNEQITSGYINTDGMVKIRADKLYKDSTVNKIIELVKHASHKKSGTEKFITKFAKIYTPIVVLLAVLITVIPVFVWNLPLNIWLKRSLTFLVISCPCAFVLSVPLTFFAGIGRAAKSGILIKGSNYIEQLAKVSDIAFDKTGTITKADYKVQKINTIEGISQEEILKLTAYAEYYSNHPIANAIKTAYKGEIISSEIKSYTEFAGLGVKILLNNDEILVGNEKLIKNANQQNSAVYISKNGEFTGSIVISDTVKEGTVEAIKEIKEQGIKPVILTGDSANSTELAAQTAGINEYYAQLLPQEKVEKLENIISKAKGTTAFIGDGINDAPVITRSDVGIAMGAIGSDAAIEAADIVIADDNLEKIPLAIKISRKTIKIAKENIIFAIVIKVLFLILSAVGLMTMWGAVFADVGVTVIAVLNSLRTLKIK